MRTNHTSRFKLALVALAGLSVGFGHGQALKKLLVTDMGLLPGGVVNQPRKVNLDGMVAGYTTKVGGSAAFLFDSGILYDLGVLPGRTNARANWINRFGLVAGTSGTGNVARGFVWNNGTMSDIPDGDPFRDWPTEGVAINDSATLLFNVDHSGSASGTTYKDGAVLRGSETITIPVGPFLAVNGTVISNLPWVGGVGPKPNGSVNAWIWEIPAPGDPVDQPTEVNVVTEPGEIANVNAISDVIFGEFGATRPSIAGTGGGFVRDGLGNPTYYQPVPFIDAGGVLFPLLLPGDTLGEINGIANDRTLVGRSGKFELRNNVGVYTWRAVVFLPVLPFDPFWQAFDISPYMPQNTGITLENLTGINDRGQMIGTYTQAGKIRSVLLTPTVTPVAISLASASVPGGFSTTGEVVIDDNAPFGGLLVNLTTNNSIVSVPATVNVPAGEDNAQFSVLTSPVTTMTPVLITAERSGFSVSTTLRVQPTALDRLVISPTFITGGQRANASAVLAGNASAGGFKVTLASSNTSVAIVPASVTVPSGQSSAPFLVYTLAVQANTPVTISASAKGVTRSVAMTVATPFLEILTVTPTQVFGGQQAPSWVQISGPAKSPGAVVTLSSSSPGVATVPANVTVLTGTRVASFQVSTVRVRFNTNVTITGTFNTQTRTDTVLVKGAALYSITTTPTSVQGGQFASGRVTMDWFPFTGGAVVSITSSNVAVAFAPPNVTVPDNNNKVNFTIGTNAVVASTDVTFTGQYLGVTKTATLTVTP